MSSKQIMTLVETQREQLEAALPVGMQVGRIQRMARTTMATNPILHQCEPISVLGALIECAQLGLEPGITGHLVPFWDAKIKGYRAQMIPDYRGLMSLARRSGEITAIHADIVRVDDRFYFSRGLHPTLEHEPALGSTADIIAAYAVAHWRGAAQAAQFEVVDRGEIDKIRDMALSKIRKESAKKYSPWMAHFDAMARKTAIRRLCKLLPFSTESADLQRAILLDESADRGEQRLGADIIDVTPELASAELEEPMSTDDRQALDNAINGARHDAD